MNTEKIRNVEIYSHNEQHQVVDKEQFVKELLDKLPRRRNTAINCWGCSRLAAMLYYKNEDNPL